MAYDIKYRRRAIEYWNDGHSKIATAEVFKVSTSTLQKWKSELKKEPGKLAYKKRKDTWKKIDPVKLKKYVAEHPDAYARETATEFGCSEWAINKAFKRLGITRKKNVGVPGAM